MNRRNMPLEVEVIGSLLVISVGIETLSFAVTKGTGREDLIRITDPQAAAKEIVRELCREEEDGTTAVHKLLDKAAFDAFEQGADGFEAAPPAGD